MTIVEFNMSILLVLFLLFGGWKKLWVMPSLLYRNYKFEYTHDLLEFLTVIPRQGIASIMTSLTLLIPPSSCSMGSE